jgi:hypothetical protein
MVAPMTLSQAKSVMAAHLMTIAFSEARSDPDVVMAWQMITAILDREIEAKKARRSGWD